MRFSKTFIKTLRAAPKGEMAVNGTLLTRAGYIHKEMAGVYDYLPLGLRVIENIKTVIREELNRLLKHAKAVNFISDQYKDILYEEFSAYFNEACSKDELIKRLSSRIGIYLNERD